ncbi:hypothetical protein [Kitasatospora setae]|uniref:hypothetical protein n=1 Tax=Kitasatospora setae TaxID=2066 RepID=UPI00068A5BB5|nr:hypothetical protein [Kitasatospora setae]
MTPAEAAAEAAAEATAPDEHPAKALDDTVHQRVRLGILTVAHQARRAGQHLTVLEKAGLVAIEKGYEGRRQANVPGAPGGRCARGGNGG